MRFNELTKISLEGEIIFREKCKHVLNCPDTEILSLLEVEGMAPED